jgi:signal transduction histidine kinase
MFSRRYQSLTRCVLIAIAIEAFLCVAGAWAQERQRQVLVLYSTRRDAQIVVVGDRELPKILEQGLPLGLDYYSEFIEQARFSETDYQRAFRDFLKLKYVDHHFDVIVAMGDIPLEFLASTRDSLFGDIPVVYFATRQPAAPIRNATGLIAEQDLRRTVTLAKELQPDTRYVFVVNGANESDYAFERAARAQFQSMADDRLSFTYLSGMPTKDLEDRLRSLPPNSIVYYLAVDRDGAGDNFHPLEYLDRVVAVSNAPVYCWVDSAMDHGIVGGSLKDQLIQTQAVGELALKILKGQPADSIPVSRIDLNVGQVDWRQLRRWGINEARVPAGTLVKFRVPSVWDRYKFYVFGAIALLLAQSMLIAALLIQRARRRQAEEQVRGSQAELRASYHHIRDLGGRLLNAQETERARIARELHDDISQQMALVEIDLEVLGRALPNDEEGLAREAMERVHSVAKSVHDLSHRLHPAKLRLIGLVAALHGLERELSRRDCAVTVTHENVPSSLPPDVTLCLFRVIQEALQNALKYSKAGGVAVHLAGDPKGLAATIVDDGVGFDVPSAWGKGLGLISMSERLEAIGGTLQIHSKPGHGTRLEIRVPVGVARSVAV